MWATIILSFIALTQVHIAGDVDEDCVLDDQNTIGTCVPIYRCEVAFRAVKGPDKTHSFRRCGFEGLTELVCCPTDSVTDKENKHGIGTSDEKRKLRIADRECEKIIESGKGVLSLYIIGGDDAQPGEFPHMVALGYTDGDGYKFGCGGSLISETYILTAAHCVGNRLDTPPSIARLGIIHLGIENADFNNVTDVRIAKVKLHPKRTPATKYHDLALLRLETPVKSNEVVNPICLSTTEADPTVPLTVTGWGQTSVSSARMKNSTLQKADLYVMEREKCGEYYKISNKYWLKLPNGIVSEQMCAHHPQGLTDACQGDSGGPLQMMSGKNYRLVGITSFGSGCGSSKPGVYTKIFPYLDWIESVVWPQ